MPYAHRNYKTKLLTSVIIFSIIISEPMIRGLFMNIEIVEGKDVTPEDIAQASYLDTLVYDKVFCAPVDVCLQWNAVNNRIYTMARDTETGKIVAYVNLSPVTDSYYEKIKSGTFLDVYLPPEAIASYDMPSCMYNLYFSSIVIHPDYQNTGVFLPLFNAIVNKFIALGDSGIFIHRMIADAVSERGRQFCRLFGMKNVKTSEHNSTIYEISLLPPQFKVSSRPTKELFDFYRTVYLENKDFMPDFDDKPVSPQPPHEEKDENFKVFISYKHKDADYRDTPDKDMAKDLYKALKARNVSVFFSEQTLKELGTAQYKQMIDSALDKAKILVVVCTNPDYVQKGWVNYEWDSFSNDILSDIKPDGKIFSYIDKVNIHDLPRTLRQQQVFVKKENSLDDICSYIINALKN